MNVTAEAAGRRPGSCPSSPRRRGGSVARLLFAGGHLGRIEEEHHVLLEGADSARARRDADARENRRVPSRAFVCGQESCCVPHLRWDLRAERDAFDGQPTPGGASQKRALQGAPGHHDVPGNCPDHADVTRAIRTARNRPCPGIPSDRSSLGHIKRARRRGSSWLSCSRLNSSARRRVNSKAPKRRYVTEEHR